MMTDKRFWEIVDLYEADPTKQRALDLIVREYYDKKNSYEDACADLDLLLKGEATKEDYEYLKNNLKNL